MRWILLLSASLLCAAPPAPERLPIRVGEFIGPGPNGTTTVQDPVAPVSFELPQGWKLTGGVRWGDHETTLQFFDTQSGQWANAYYQYPLTNPPAPDLDAVLRLGLEKKIRQRNGEGLVDYSIRKDSVQQAIVDGRPALSWVADFTARGPGHPRMTEYMFRYIGANGKADVFTQMPSLMDVGWFVNRMLPIIQSLRIP